MQPRFIIRKKCKSPTVCIVCGRMILVGKLMKEYLGGWAHTKCCLPPRDTP